MAYNYPLLLVGVTAGVCLIAVGFMTRGKSALPEDVAAADWKSFLPFFLCVGGGIATIIMTMFLSQLGR